MHRPAWHLKKALLVLSAVSALALSASAPAAQSHPSALSNRPYLVTLQFYADKDAHGNCGASVWDAASGSCNASVSTLRIHPSYALFRPSGPTVTWCEAAAKAHCAIGAGHGVPAGDYTRWVKVCLDRGCEAWFVGAMAMPTGAFSVVAGSIHGQPVHRDSGDQSKIGKVGGPLHLMATYTSGVRRGGGVTSDGYVFELTGFLRF